MNAFLRATTWHYNAFLIDGMGDVWRVWFDHNGQPCMEKLIGHQFTEYREPIAVLSKRSGGAWQLHTVAGLPMRRGERVRGDVP